MSSLIIVNPNNRNKSPFGAIEPAFRCGLLADFIRRKGHRVRILDAEAEGLTASETAGRIKSLDATGLVVIIAQGANPSATSTPKMAAVRDLLEYLEDHTTLLIGTHPSALPEQTAREEKATYVCVGDGFQTVLGLLNGENHSEISGIWLNPAPPLLKGLPNIAYDLLPMHLYRAHNWHSMGREKQPYGVTYTSLGCPYDCYYCNIKAINNGKPGIRYRQSADVVRDIYHLHHHYGVRNIKIMDELFVIDRDRINHLCDLIIGTKLSNLNLFAETRVDSVDEEILRKMAQAGFRWLCYGFESGDIQVRKGVGKSFKQERVEQVIEMTKRVGISIIANFIFGLPDDDYDSMYATLAMAKKHKFEYVNFYSAMAYPGSDLYRDAVSEGVPLPKTWAGYNQYGPGTMPMATKQLTGQQVLEFRDKAFLDYFADEEYLRSIRDKFGQESVDEIGEMLKWKIRSS